jgi:leucine-rich repeat transmembrane neuronal protein 1/2
METVEFGAFNGLTELTHLSLSHNQIREIIPGTFEKMDSLEYLDLAHNLIEQLEVDVFSGLVNLKHIHLEENKLLDLHPDLFVGLYKLQSLYLSNNPDLEIPTDLHFINSHSLLSLDLSGCDVSSVSVETFANVTALELLDLSHNSLGWLDINILTVLPKLSELYLHDNPLECDCQLQEVWRWCQDHDIQTEYEGNWPHCAIPNQEYSLPWETLKELHCV